MNLSSPLNLLLAGCYFVIVGILVFFSVFGVYVLIRYGQNRIAALLGSLLYTIFCLSILSSSYQSLLQLLQ